MDVFALLAALLPIVVFAYLFSFFRLIKKIADQEMEYWKRIGRPSPTDPGGQLIILRKIILGAQLPADIAGSYKKSLWIARALLVIGLLIMITLAAIAMMKSS